MAIQLPNLPAGGKPQITPAPDYSTALNQGMRTGLASRQVAGNERQIVSQEKRDEAMVARVAAQTMAERAEANRLGAIRKALAEGDERSALTYMNLEERSKYALGQTQLMTAATEAATTATNIGLGGTVAEGANQIVAREALALQELEKVDPNSFGYADQKAQWVARYGRVLKGDFLSKANALVENRDKVNEWWRTQQEGTPENVGYRTDRATAESKELQVARDENAAMAEMPLGDAFDALSKATTTEEVMGVMNGLGQAAMLADKDDFDKLTTLMSKKIDQMEETEGYEPSEGLAKSVIDNVDSKREAISAARIAVTEGNISKLLSIIAGDQRAGATVTSLLRNALGDKLADRILAGETGDDVKAEAAANQKKFAAYADRVEQRLIDYANSVRDKYSTEHVIKEYGNLEGLRSGSRDLMKDDTEAQGNTRPAASALYP